MKNTLGKYIVHHPNVDAPLAYWVRVPRQREPNRPQRYVSKLFKFEEFESKKSAFEHAVVWRDKVWRSLWGNNNALNEGVFYQTVDGKSYRYRTQYDQHKPNKLGSKGLVLRQKNGRTWLDCSVEVAGKTRKRCFTFNGVRQNRSYDEALQAAINWREEQVRKYYRKSSPIITEL